MRLICLFGLYRQKQLRTKYFPSANRRLIPRQRFLLLHDKILLDIWSILQSLSTSVTALNGLGNPASPAQPLDSVSVSSGASTPLHSSVSL